MSYAFENINEALAGLFRIVRPGGVIIASVMSLLETWRFFIEGVIQESENIGEDANDAVLRTGDLRHMGGSHVCQMFRSRDISKLVERCGGRVLGMSSSNWTSLEKSEALVQLESDPERWQRFLEHEIAACAEPGALDGGTHILFAATKWTSTISKK